MLCDRRIVCGKPPMARRGGGGIFSGMSRSADRLGSPAPLKSFRCVACGYGAARRSTPHRCPMCGSTNWQDEGWKPFAALLGDLAAGVAEADEEASAPLQREADEVDASSILPRNAGELLRE
jgi:hypothetical protein